MITILGWITTLLAIAFTVLLVIQYAYLLQYPDLRVLETAAQTALAQK